MAVDPFKQPRDPNVISGNGPTTPSDSEIREFERNMTELTNAYMRGDLNDGVSTRFMEVPRHQSEVAVLAEEDRGQMLRADAVQVAPAATQPDSAFDGAVPAESATEDFRTKYGRALNQLGTERQTWASERDELARQMQALQLQVIQAQQAAQRQPVYTPPPVPAMPNPLANRAPDDPLTTADLEAWRQHYEQTEVIPALQAIEQRAVAAAYQRAVADSQRLFGGWDVTPAEEAAVLAKFPFATSLSAPDRNRLILEHVHALRANAPALPTATRPVITPVGQATTPPQHVVVDPRRVISQQTFVESAPPVQASYANEDTPEAVEARIRNEFANAKTAADMERLFAKYGVSRTNDWGGGVSVGR